VPEGLREPLPAGACRGSSCACKAPPGGKAPALGAGDRLPKYQYGRGCLSDQLLGQFLAFQCGLGYLLDPGRVKSALRSVYRYNFLPRLGDFSNVQRVFALNDEAGLLLCTWPKGGRPALPFVYSDEVWTGVEYQVAASLIRAGLVEEGLRLVRAVRDRYDGLRRNPWDEIECGHQYARALASWAVMDALNGYSWDGVRREMTFLPLLEGKEFRAFWSTGSAWGTMEIRQKSGRLRVLHGKLSLASLVVRPKCKCTGPIPVRKDGRLLLGVAARRDPKRRLVRLVFEKPLVLQAGQVLMLGRQEPDQASSQETVDLAAPGLFLSDPVCQNGRVGPVLPRRESLTPWN